jgi:serine protease Do
MLRELNPQERKKLSVRGGLLVTNSQGVAAQAGIRRGDVLLAVGDVEVQNQGQLNRLLDAIPAGKSVALRMMRGDSLFFVSVKTAEKK